jgi:hypothetical protein
MTYSIQTNGIVGSSNTGVVTLNSTPTTVPLLAPGTINLGTFQVQPQPDGVSVNYNNVPFHIWTTMQETSGEFPKDLHLDITGVLNGTITGSSNSDLTAQITSVTPSSTWGSLFPASMVQFNAPQVIAPSGTTTLTAFLPAAIPEPGTLALFGVTFAGALMLRRRRRVA